MKNMHYDLNDFLNLSSEDICKFTRFHGIKTCYLPVDGTRRYFLSKSINKSKWSDQNMEEYFSCMKLATINLLQRFYSYGVENMILLLMDSTSFNRGENYLKHAIELGIKPLIYDKDYLEFYDIFDIQVSIGGFNHLYSKKKFQNLLKDFSKIEKLTMNNSRRKLLFYTGSSPSEDYLLLIDTAMRLKEIGEDITRENLIRFIYKIRIPTIDFSIWYLSPRDKIIPPLLWNTGTRFYSPVPTFSITKEMIKKAIYYAAIQKKSINDNYIDYTHENLINGSQNEYNWSFKETRY